MFVPTSMAFARAGDRGGYNQYGDNGNSFDGGDYNSWGYNGDGNNYGGYGDRGDHGHRHVFVCNGTYSGIRVRDLVVPPSGVCLITNSVIEGSVDVPYNGDFEAGATSIRGNVEAEGAQTVYIYADSSVGGDIETLGTAQTQIFESTVTGGIRVRRGTDQVYLCHNIVGRGISVTRSGPNILVGDIQDPNCLGNVVDDGSIFVAGNSTYVELVVGDNSVPNGSIFVADNGGTPVGTSGESVEGNQGGHALICEANAAPFVGSPNPGWSYYAGQCSALTQST
jgi:hypothetical protein